MSKVKIKSDRDGTTEILIDDVNVSGSISKFEVEQVAGEPARVTLEFIPEDMEIEAVNPRVRRINVRRRLGDV